MSRYLLGGTCRCTCRCIRYMEMHKCSAVERKGPADMGDVHTLHGVGTRYS